MLVNSAGYKILTSVDRYLELVNSSLPGEWTCWLWAEEHRHPDAAGHPLGAFGKEWSRVVCIPGGLEEGVVLRCGAVGKENSLFPLWGVRCSVRCLLLGSSCSQGRKEKVSAAPRELPQAAAPSLSVHLPG